MLFSTLVLQGRHGWMCQRTVFSGHGNLRISFCAISLQEMLTAAKEANTTWAGPLKIFCVEQLARIRKDFGDISFLCLSSWDDVRGLIETSQWIRHRRACLLTIVDGNAKSLSITSCSALWWHFLPASGRGCCLLWVSHAPCPSKQLVFAAADLALNFSSRQKKKKKKKSAEWLMLSDCRCLAVTAIIIRSADHRLHMQATHTGSVLLSFCSSFKF